MPEMKSKDGDFKLFRWRTREGGEVAVRNMGDQHLVNTMRGLMRRLSVHQVAWHYWYYNLTRDLAYPARADRIHKYAIAQIHMRTGEEPGFQTLRQFTALTAMRMEAEFRGLDWWDHDKRCSCSPCKQIAIEGAKYYEQNPNYEPM